jgi:cytochrome c oxidase cbb3-type subunit 4
VDLPTLRGLSTLLLMLTFIGIVIWAWSSKRKKDFEEAAQLPLDDDAVSASSKDIGGSASAGEKRQ